MKLLQFLLERFKVKYIKDVDPYGEDTMDAWEACEMRTLTFDLKGIGNLTIERVAQPNAQLAQTSLDLLDVSVTGLFIRHVKNFSGRKIDICMGFRHILQREEAEDAAAVAFAAGLTPGKLFEIDDYAQEPVKFNMLAKVPDCMFLHEYFVRSMFCITPQNLRNGCILLPERFPDLPDTAEVLDEKGMLVQFPVTQYVLVPGDHMLAWPLRCADLLRRQHQIFAKEFLVQLEENEPPRILFFIVAKQCFDAIERDFIKNYLNERVDHRPLTDVGVCLQPQEPGPAQAEVRLCVTFVARHTNVRPEQIRPVLHKGFPTFLELYSQKAQMEMVRNEKKK